MASINGEINGQPTARTFVENVLSKYLKIVKVCDNAKDCDFPTTFKTADLATNVNLNNLKYWADLHYAVIKDNPGNVNITDTNLSVYLISADGFRAKLFYNPNCINNSINSNYMVIDTTCINIIYDMNGVKSPNVVGKDIGVVTTFWSGAKATSVAPGFTTFSDHSYKTYNQAQMFCLEKATGKAQYSLPNIDELKSMLLNRSINLTAVGAYYWSGSLYGKDSQYVQAVKDEGYGIYQGLTRNSGYTMCVRR